MRPRNVGMTDGHYRSAITPGPRGSRDLQPSDRRDRQPDVHASRPRAPALPEGRPRASDRPTYRVRPTLSSRSPSTWGRRDSPTGRQRRSLARMHPSRSRRHRSRPRISRRSRPHPMARRRPAFSVASSTAHPVGVRAKNRSAGGLAREFRHDLMGGNAFPRFTKKRTYPGRPRTFGMTDIIQLALLWTCIRANVRCFYLGSSRAMIAAVVDCRICALFCGFSHGSALVGSRVILRLERGDRY